MRAVLIWIDDRSGVRGLVRKCLDAPVREKASWGKVWPLTILFTFLIQVVTGLFLWMYYSPSAQTAWESIYYLQYQVTGGWLLRAVHHYSAQVMLVLIGIYLIQTIVSGAYRAPRELVFWVTVLLGLACLALLLTGDLLAWDQNSYACTKVRVGFLNNLSVIGDGLRRLVTGGPDLGHLALTRFVALHIGVFSAGFLLLLVLHGTLARKVESAEASEAENSVPLWPGQAIRDVAASLVALAIILLLAVQQGVELGAPADPATGFADARPELAFRGLYAFHKLFPSNLEILPIFVFPPLLLCVVLAMPFVGRRKAGHYFNVGFTTFILLALVVMSWQSMAEDLGDKRHQDALAAARKEADRYIELAGSPDRIPPGGAKLLLRNDPKTQGPILFEAHCAACHDYVGGQHQDIKAESPSGPNLYGYATRNWVAGWFDLQRITGQDYFGETKFADGDMVANLQAMYEDLDEDELEDQKQDFATLAAGLSAEAELKSQQELDQNDDALIREGKGLIDDFGCTGCHKFQDKGSLGTAPELTGYGSREWTIAIISNPADKRFYGDENDRMPAYAEFDDPAKNTLSAKDIGLLTDWLRGEWYEP